MSEREPTRFSAGNGPGRALVASMTSEGLAPDARDRMRAALGLSVAAGAAAGATKAAAATTGVKGAGAALAAKLAGAALVVGAVSGIGVYAVRGAPASSVQPPAVASVAPRSRRPPLVLRAPTAATETTSVASLPDVAPPAKAAKHAVVKAPDLGEEVRLLELARQALRGGDANGALRSLADYRSAKPHGALVVEADALEVEALVAAGRGAEAESRGRTFLRRHPEGPLSERVRRLIGS